MSINQHTSSRPYPTRFSRRGFTLIELLIVMAIIALLAEILFPVFSRAREAARRSSCASNLKQLATAMHMYTQDYDEHFCLGRASYYMDTSGNVVASTAPGASRQTWPDFIDPYTKTSGIFNDPNDFSKYFDGCQWLTGTGAGTACGANGSTQGEPYSGHTQPYVYNGHLAQCYDPLTQAFVNSRDFIGYGMAQKLENNTLPYKGAVALVAYAGEKVLFAETAYYELQQPSSGACGKAIPRHFNGVMAAFVDGHVKWMQWSNFCASESSSTDSQHLWFVNGINN